MLRVALCEDESIIAETQAGACREILGRMSVPYEIAVFGSAEDVLTAFSNNGNRFDFILLDIVMDGMDGLALAKRIRETDRETAIVFLTSHAEFWPMGYDHDVRAFHYLIKPVKPEELEKLIRIVYREKYQANYYVLKTGPSNQRIAIRDIIALETVGRTVEIATTGNRTLTYRGKLADLLRELPGGHFIRCHRAYAVNPRNIAEFHRTEVIAVNGKRIPVSRSYLKQASDVFLKYMQDKKAAL
jgi:DNA-binding LytR/AlgR family response regulator